MILDIGHPAYSVVDIERSIQFYAKLGINEAFRLYNDDGSLMLVYLHVAGDRFIELFPNRSGTGISADTSYRHLCLLVDDLGLTLEDLRRQGVDIDRGPILGRDNNWQAWISDPDGNPIELMQISKDSPQYKAAHSS